MSCVSHPLMRHATHRVTAYTVFMWYRDMEADMQHMIQYVSQSMRIQGGYDA